MLTCRRTRRNAASVVALTALLAGPLILDASASDAAPATSPARDIAYSSIELSSIDAIAADDVWCVGEWVVGDGAPVTEHFDGQSWSLVSSQKPDTRFMTDLDGVSGTASDDVWAVGTYQKESTQYAGWSEHWNGGTWTRVKVRNPGSTYNSLFAVAAVSTDSAYAVGGKDGYPLVERWDGTSWSVMRTPKVSGLLRSVSAVSDDDVWAVGDNGYDQLVTLHWNGRKWRAVPAPEKGTQMSLTGVVAISADDAWAVGYRAGAGGTHRTYVLQWTGRHWHRRVHPIVGKLSKFRELTGVSASSPDDVWAVGWYDAAHGLTQNETLHFDGTEWTAVEAPNGRGMSYLNAVSDLSPTSAFAVGDNYDSEYFLQWDGTQWNYETR